MGKNTETSIKSAGMEYSDRPPKERNTIFQ